MLAEIFIFLILLGFCIPLLEALYVLFRAIIELFHLDYTKGVRRKSKSQKHLLKAISRIPKPTPVQKTLRPIIRRSWRKEKVISTLKSYSKACKRCGRSFSSLREDLEECPFCYARKIRDALD